jgi:hypothetical protein
MQHSDVFLRWPQSRPDFLAGCHEATTGGVTMHGLASVKRNCQANDHLAEQISKPLNLYKTILQTERDQKADAARIDDAIMKVENEIARLELRQLAPQELHEAIIAIRDRTILIIRDVRKNMERRALAASRMQACLSDEFLRQRSRFAADDFEDKSLRTQLFQRLECTPTFALTDHFWDAAETGNAARAELIRFEFQCREDRHEFMASFEAIVAKLSPNDPVEMRKRIANIRKAIEKVDATVIGLLDRVRLACPTQEGATAAT